MVRIHGGSKESDYAPTPRVDGPSPKLDQHEPSHSRTLHVINDAYLTWWTTCHYAWWEAYKCMNET